MDGPLLGLLGGMGPLATADFLAQLVHIAGGSRDQDHHRVVVYSNPRIPDRSDAILGRGPSPLPDLLAGLALLERSGADVIAIPCNTAHHWLPELASATAVPILGIVEAVLADLGSRRMANGRIGLLGTAGVIRSGIYQRGLKTLGFEAIVPSPRHIEDLAEASINLVKAGAIDAAKPLAEMAVRELEASGVDAVILGCTELPLALTSPISRGGTPYVDSTKCLATACLAWMAARERQGCEAAMAAQDRID